MKYEGDMYDVYKIVIIVWRNNTTDALKFLITVDGRRRCRLSKDYIISYLSGRMPKAPTNMWKNTHNNG